MSEVIAIPQAIGPQYLSKLGFRNRFTMNEKAKIELASIDDVSAPLQARMLAARLRATLADQRDATYIDPMRLDTREGVVDLETAGLLDAPGRALQILDAPIQEEERYKG